MKMPKEISSSMKAKSCLGALINFYAASKRELADNNPFSMANILDQLTALLIEISNIGDNHEAKRKIFFTSGEEEEEEDNQNECIIANVNGSKFEITKSHIESMCLSIDELKKIVAMNTLCENADSEDIHHFRFLSERREVITKIIEPNDASEKGVDFILEKYIIKNVIESLVNGVHSKEITSNVTLTSTHHRFFTVSHLSNFGKLILRCKYEQDNDKSDSMNIPDLLYDSWLNLGTIIASIVVHYHFAFGDFQRVRQCRTCGNMFIESRLGTEFCSKKCSQIGWVRKKENDTYDLIKCRERQKQFFNYGEKMQLQWLKEDCVGCSRKPLPQGGQCTRWRDKHGEEEIDRRLAKRGER